MAETTETSTAATPDLAPNMWFTEYGMPYTTMILESEAEFLKENPDAVAGDRHPLAQFIIDQETAVAQDYAAGKISEAEFNDFKALSEGRIEAMQDSLEKEIDELSEDGEAWADDFVKELEGFGSEHKAEIEKLVETAKERDLEACDVSLHLAADYLGTTFEGVDKLFEMLPPHLHDVIDVIENETLDTAHAMVDAREELDSAEEHNLDGERAELEEIQPVFEAQIDDVHEAIDDSFDRIDADIEKAKDFADTAREHAELNPDTTVEHFPYQITEDYDAIDQMEEDVGTQV